MTARSSDPAAFEARRAVRDPALSAHVVARRALVYNAGADSSLDRPAHVRAASGIARIDRRLFIVQDDANFIAIVDPASGRVDTLNMPAGHEGARQFDEARGNKRFKLDLEACFVAVASNGEPMLIALGSGSTDARERAVIISDLSGVQPRISLVEAPALYALLRTSSGFAGSELNVEGAILLGDALWLFGRGNGRVRGDLHPVNATCVLDWPSVAAYLKSPATASRLRVEHGTRYDLGTIDGIALGFTDATAAGDSIIYSAAAEDSPDAISDGPVTGSCLGIIPPSGTVRWARITNADGTLFAGKVEGITWCGDGRDRLSAVLDPDDPETPAELCTIALDGAWI